MDALGTLRTTGSVRAFTDEPVSDDLLHRVLDTARFAPNGGNRQPWHVVVVKNEATRERLRELYIGPWIDYLSLSAGGLTPWSPLNDPAEESAILDQTEAGTWDAVADASVGSLFGAPVILAVFADLGCVVATDRELERFPLVAGASVYPFVWSVLLAAKSEGLGGVLTTMHARNEAEVAELLGAGALALAAVIFLGHPEKTTTRLRRDAVEKFTTVDRLDGPPFTTS